MHLLYRTVTAVAFHSRKSEQFLRPVSISRPHTMPASSKAKLEHKFSSCSTADQILEGVNLKGKTFLVTGGTVGIGYATVKALAKKGAYVTFTGRNAKAAADVTEELKKDGNQVEFVALDLSSFANIRSFAEKFKANHSSLDVLILNAGMFGTPWAETVDGYEAMFQVNVLSQLYLLLLLKPLLVKSAPSRVVFVASDAHRMGAISTKTLSREFLCPPKQTYSSWTQYNNTKLQQVVLSNYLQEDWAKDRVSFYALHPGHMIYTGISRSSWFWNMVWTMGRPFTKSLDQGAATTVYCACRPELAQEGGKYWNNSYVSEPVPAVNDKTIQKALWDLCQGMLADKIEGYQKC